MKIESVFSVAYPNGWEVVDESTVKRMDLNFRKFVSHYIAIRAGKEFDIDDLNRRDNLYFKLKTDGNVILRIEFKTKTSSKYVDSMFFCKILGITEYNGIFTIPKLSEPIKEICITALKSDNMESTAKFFEISQIEII